MSNMQCPCVLLPSDLLGCAVNSTLSYKLHDIKKKLLNTKSVFWISLQLKRYSFYEEPSEIWSKICWFSCKVPIILVGFSVNLNFFDTFSKSIKMSNFLKICPLGAELFHADGQTGMTKLIAAFRNFAKAPKKKWYQNLTLNVPR